MVGVDRADTETYHYSEVLGKSCSYSPLVVSWRPEATRMSCRFADRRGFSALAWN